jgi:hypothetical protein
MNGLVIAPEPEEKQRALTDLESMVRSWEPQLKIGYSLAPNMINVDGTTDSMIIDTAFEAVTMNLAIRILRHSGKEANSMLRSDAANAKRRLYCQTPVKRKQNPMQPSGAGNTRCYEGLYGAYMPTHDPCECDEWPDSNY